MRLRAILLGLTAALTCTACASATAPSPPGWPYDTLQLGLKNDTPPASNVQAWAPMGFVYQYLTGGAGQPGNWRGWNDPDGQFATDFIRDTRDAGMTPVFTYYQLLYTRPGTGGEAQVVLANLNHTATMKKYFADFKVMLQKAAGFPDTEVVVHVEPDLWGYAQQDSSGDDGATVPAKVAATGLSELASLPNTAAGFAQGLVRLRGLYAPNVILAYHMSTWGTGVDPVYANPGPNRVTALATRAATFYKSLAAPFDLTFAEFSDRDSGFKLVIDGRSDAFWTPFDFDNNIRWLDVYGDAVGHRLVVWQIPFGNTKLRTENNAPKHYQSNHVETLLDDPTGTRLRQYRDAGVIAFMFGTGEDNQTHINDFAGDGVTNPAPINGNTQSSTAPDDDGGFFKAEAAAYYAAGALALDEGSGPTATTFTGTAAVSPASAVPGNSVSIQAWVTCTGVAVPDAIVQVNVYDASGRRVFNRDTLDQPFATNQTRSYAATWTPTEAGTYTVKLGTFSDDWGQNYYWNDAARVFTVE